MIGWDLLLGYVLGPGDVRLLLDGQSQAGRKGGGEELGQGLLRDGPLGRPVGLSFGLTLGVSARLALPRDGGGVGGRGLVLAGFADGARLADAVLGLQTHATVLALWQTVR